MKRLIAILTLTIPCLVAAQGVTTGSIRGDNAGVGLPEDRRLSGDEARAVSDKFAACVVSRHYTPVVKALELTNDSAEQYAALHKVFDNECWATGSAYGGSSIEMNTNPVSFRNSLFKALVKKRYAEKPLIPSTSSLPISGRNAGMLALADCVVRLDNATSLKLVLAPAGSTAEVQAVNELRPQLAQCLAPGATVSLSKVSLSAAIAEAYYREAKASAQAAGAK